ncbi:MAG: hypothetical protein AMJ56_07605 [Anaerolineae bacterium SG8_19]|nr:MAG: hypothetical protein AMJ56_07605 [Anaerolineae bacterium SG8_19]
MIIVKSKITGKFLRQHSGSYNDFKTYRCRWKVLKKHEGTLPKVPPGQWNDPEVIRKRGEREAIISELVHQEAFNAEPLDARRYASVGSAKQSLYSHYWRDKDTSWIEFHEIVAGNLCLVNPDDDEETKRRKEKHCK